MSSGGYRGLAEQVSRAVNRKQYKTDEF